MRIPCTCRRCGGWCAVEGRVSSSPCGPNDFIVYRHDGGFMRCPYCKPSEDGETWWLNPTGGYWAAKYDAERQGLTNFGLEEER